MKKIFLIMFIFLLVGCKVETKNNDNITTKEEKSIIDKKVDETISSMSLEERIGQLLVIKYWSYEVNDQ